MAFNFFAGPEIFYMKRTKQGGTTQSGRVDGFRVGIERYKRYGWYLGADYFIAQGRVQGRNSKKMSLKSTLRDHIVEGRLGFTLQKSGSLAAFTPFIGYGYFRETNAFYHPSPTAYTFVDSFNYVVTGFFASRNFSPLLSMGLNLKIDFMLEGNSKIKNDPLYGCTKLKMDRALQARVEIPVYITLTSCALAEFTPFYEHRRFGGREGHPFDFLDTQFQLVGMRFALSYNF